MISTFCWYTTDIVSFLKILLIKAALNPNLLMKVPVCTCCPDFLSDSAFVQDVCMLLLFLVGVTSFFYAHCINLSGDLGCTKRLSIFQDGS